MTAPTATAPVTSLRALRRTPPRRGHPRAFQHHSDGDVYAGIAHDWFQMYRAGERHEHLMRTFLVRPGFAEEVWGRPDVDPQDVLTTCARLVALEDFRLREVATMTREGEKLSETLDPSRGWWLALKRSPDLGIHFWQLVLVPIELRCIGPVDDPPLLQYQRFA